MDKSETISMKASEFRSGTMDNLETGNSTDLNVGTFRWSTLYVDDIALMKPVTNIVFCHNDGSEIMKFEANGDIYVKGRLVENDKEVVDGLREFLTASKTK